MEDINRLHEILLETSEDSHKTRKAWIPTHYAHGIVALNHLGATEERIREFIQWQVASYLHPFYFTLSAGAPRISSALFSDEFGIF